MKNIAFLAQFALLLTLSCSSSGSSSGGGNGIGTSDVSYKIESTGVTCFNQNDSSVFNSGSLHSKTCTW